MRHPASNSMTYSRAILNEAASADSPRTIRGVDDVDPTALGRDPAIRYIQHGEDVLQQQLQV